MWKLYHKLFGWDYIHWHNTDFRDPNDECIPLALAAVPKPCEAHASQSHA